MKKIFFTIFSVVLIMPLTVGAQLRRPADNYGLASGRSIDQVIYSAIYYVLGFLASLAVLMIIISGIMYMTSAGDETRVEKAKSWLTYSIVGLVVSLLAWTIVRFVSTILGAR